MTPGAGNSSTTRPARDTAGKSRTYLRSTRKASRSGTGSSLAAPLPWSSPPATAGGPAPDPPMPRRAFTLLEVSLVAVLILMLAMIAYPSIESIYGGVRLTAAADLIRARWADARAHAVDEVKPYRFAIIADTGRFRVAPDTTDHWDRGGLPPDDFDDADTRL